MSRSPAASCFPPAWAVDFDDTLREGIEEAILNGDPSPAQPDGAIEHLASVATVVALTVLGETDEDDLEDPIQAWIRTRTKITALYRSDRGPGYWIDASLYGCEILLPSCVDGVSAHLITGADDDYAQLIVSRGLAITINLVHCPIVIGKALRVVEDC